MLVIGTKGFAKEILEIFHQLNKIKGLCFYDDVTPNMPDLLYEQFEIISDIKEAEEYFSKTDNRFVLGVGGPNTRYTLSTKFAKMGGQLSSVISPKSEIGHYNTVICKGSNIMTGVVITNDVCIAEGCLINLNCTIGHNSHIGKYWETSPGVHVSGRCNIGEFCNLGTGCVVLPDIKIGNNVTVGAGAVVNRNIDDDQVVVGIPAKPIVKK